MKQKIVLTLSLIFLLALAADAQFHHAGGAGLVMGKGKIPTGAEAGSEQPSIMGYGVFYHPRFNLSETESGAISIGIPATAGISGSVNSREGGSINLIIDLPLTAEYNFGLGSTDDNESGFGGFIGAGFGLTYSNYTDEFYIPGVVEYYEQVKGTSYGPLAHAGIRALIGEKTYFLRAFYKMGLEKAKFKTFGLSVGISL